MSLFPPPYTAAGTRAVGIVASAFGDAYALNVMHGAAQELREDGFHAICCMDGFPTAPFFQDERGEPILPSAFDAGILLCETLRESSAEMETVAHGARVAVTIGA